MADRTWFAEAAYPGHKPFYLGTVIADGEEHARRELLALWARISPHPTPDIRKVEPGVIIVRRDHG